MKSLWFDPAALDRFIAASQQDDDTEPDVVAVYPYAVTLADGQDLKFIIVMAESEAACRDDMAFFYPHCLVARCVAQPEGRSA